MPRKRRDLVARAKKPVVRVIHPSLLPPPIVRTPTEEVEELRVDMDVVKRTAARLYGQGFSRGEVAKAMADHLIPVSKARTPEQKVQSARMKLRRWEATQDFRDMVYQQAVVKLDMSTPQILAGVGSRAKRGRVDAARLALEITGRHSSKGDTVVTEVKVNLLNAIPRPQ